MAKTSLKNNIKIIHKNFDYIQKTYHVKKIGVFGSMARCQQRESSDIDVLVELSRPMGFFKFLELEDFLG